MEMGLIQWAICLQQGLVQIQTRFLFMLVLILIHNQQGGKYDGVLGVLGGLEVIRTLNDLDVNKASNCCGQLD